MDESPAELTLPRRPGVDVAVIAGGIAGALLRVAIARLAPPHAGEWPWATFAANLAGTLVLGVSLRVIATGQSVWPYWRPLLATGFCGALTTFSTFQLDVFTDVRTHHLVSASAYLAASTALGLAAIRLTMKAPA